MFMEELYNEMLIAHMNRGPTGVPELDLTSETCCELQIIGFILFTCLQGALNPLLSAIHWVFECYHMVYVRMIDITQDCRAKYDNFNELSRKRTYRNSSWLNRFNHYRFSKKI